MKKLFLVLSLAGVFTFATVAVSAQTTPQKATQTTTKEVKKADTKVDAKTAACADQNVKDKKCCTKGSKAACCKDGKKGAKATKCDPAKCKSACPDKAKTEAAKPAEKTPVTKDKK